MKTLCDICQKVAETKVIGGNTVCSQEVTESEWEQGKLYTDPAFVFPEQEPDISEIERDGEIGVCPDCERPNQFGEVCQSCRDEQERLAEEEGQRWADEREGNGYPTGTIGAETR
jgi:hypothetical protein